MNYIHYKTTRTGHGYVVPNLFSLTLKQHETSSYYHQTCLISSSFVYTQDASRLHGQESIFGTQKLHVSLIVDKEWLSLLQGGMSTNKERHFSFVVMYAPFFQEWKNNTHIHTHAKQRGQSRTQNRVTETTFTQTHCPQLPAERVSLETT